MMLHVMVLVTSECNLSCRYCFSIANVFQSKESLTMENATKIISNIDIPVSYVSLSGGEPLLHPLLAQLYTLFEQRYPTWITTNGTINCHDSLRTLASEKDINVTISLNAINQEVDYVLRGTYCKVEDILKNLRFLIDTCKRLKVNTIVSCMNIDDLYMIGNYLTRVNVRSNLTWNLLQVTLNPNVIFNCSELLISNDEFIETINNLQQMYSDNINMKASTSAELNRNCYMVSPYGDVFNLQKSNRPIGNILDSKLGSII